MIMDLEKKPTKGFSTTVCIIGAGAAGLTIARELLRHDIDVCLLESGGSDYDHTQQELNDGANIGFDYYDLKSSRLRIFGGTTAIWGGRCAELDPIDFTQRPSLPYSGWPISAAQMRYYYKVARDMLDLPHSAPNNPKLLQSPVSTASAVNEDFEIARWEFDSKHDRFQMHNVEDITNHKNATVLLNSTVTRLEVAPTGNDITSARVKTPSGRTLSVQAKTFILAAGGLENPRLLLASNDHYPEGIGNKHDLVGRFFMEHPRARAGRIMTRDPLKLLRLFRQLKSINGVRTASLIRPTDELQRRTGILNHGMTVTAVKPAGKSQNLVLRVYNNLRHELSPNRSNRTLWRTIRNAAIWLNEKAEPWLSAALVKLKLRELCLIVRAEQSPNPNSRITLSSTKDMHGVPKIELDWQFQDIDKKSVNIMLENFDGFLRKHDLGKVEPARWLDDPTKKWEIDPLISTHAIGGYHHMGTTRMASSPEQGVVDENSKVFGIHNPYVAGSSVFPTGGWANPTLTIVALSQRLAEHVTTLHQEIAEPERDIPLKYGS